MGGMEVDLSCIEGHYEHNVCLCMVGQGVVDVRCYYKVGLVTDVLRSGAYAYGSRCQILSARKNPQNLHQWKLKNSVMAKFWM